LERAMQSRETALESGEIEVEHVEVVRK